MSARIIAIAALITVATAGASSASLHTRLTKAEPGVGATVTTAPAQVRLWFSEEPEVALSAVTLLTGDSAVVAKLAMAATDDAKSIGGPIPAALAPGDYIVSWKTAARDGHPARGKYKFTYRPQ